MGRSAPAAVLGVEGVLQFLECMGAVLDPEEDDVGAALAGFVLPEVSDERVVRVQDVCRPARSLRDQPRPIVGQPLELAVAVELVAEEVAKDDRVRLELIDECLNPGLVDLEEAEFTLNEAAGFRSDRAARSPLRRACSLRSGCARS